MSSIFAWPQFLDHPLVLAGFSLLLFTLLLRAIISRLDPARLDPALGRFAILSFAIVSCACLFLGFGLAFYEIANESSTKRSKPSSPKYRVEGDRNVIVEHPDGTFNFDMRSRQSEFKRESR